MSLLEAIDVNVAFPLPGQSSSRKTWNAVEGACLKVEARERVGIVGESGSGKTTLAKALLALEPLAAGRVLFNGEDVAALDRKGMERFRRGAQMIFQDPMGSLNPRMSVGAAIGEVLAVHRLGTASERPKRVSGLLAQVGLDPDYAGRYPHEFSGGQRQRIGIARALALGPSLLVADEPVSALDVSVQAQVLNLLADLSAQRQMAILLIAHDLAVVRTVCERVLVMYLGRIVEEGPAEEIFSAPLHPYTMALRAAVPDPDDRPADAPAVGVADGETPSACRKPAGCVFHTRCPRAAALCRERPPVLREINAGRRAACHFPG